MLAGYEKVLCGADNQHTAWLKKETLEKPLADMFLGASTCTAHQPSHWALSKPQLKAARFPPGSPRDHFAGALSGMISIWGEPEVNHVV